MTKPESESILENYVGFSNLLRTWLTTYGIGFFAFVASQTEIVAKLSANKEAASCVLICIISALSLQVFAAFIYKYSMAFVHQGYGSTTKGRVYKLAFCLYSSYWIELLIDFLTISLYVFGTFKLIKLVVGVV